MDATALWKRIALKAALSPVVLVTWAGTAGAAAWMHSAWPVTVGAGLTLAWIVAGSRSAHYRDAVLADVRKEREARAVAERAQAVQQVGTLLDEAPLRGWIQSGMLPDYLHIYRRLSEIRDRVARIARERADRRLVGRLGDARAIVAVAHSILVIAYHIIRDGKPYQELGATFHEQRSQKAVVRRLTQRLEDLGFSVNLQPKEDSPTAQAA